MLQARIGDLPVPDLPSKLDGYFFKLRRHAGESMHTWGIRSIETYRLLLQALDRVKGIIPDLAQDFESGDPTWSAGAWDEERWEEPQE